MTSYEDITTKIKTIINKYTLENNNIYRQFFIKVKDRLLDETEDTEDEDT